MVSVRRRDRRDGETYACEQPEPSNHASPARHLLKDTRDRWARSAESRPRKRAKRRFSRGGGVVAISRPNWIVGRKWPPERPHANGGPRPCKAIARCSSPLLRSLRSHCWSRLRSLARKRPRSTGTTSAASSRARRG